MDDRFDEKIFIFQIKLCTSIIRIPKLAENFILTLFKINLSNFENDRYIHHIKPQIDHMNMNFWIYAGSHKRTFTWLVDRFQLNLYYIINICQKNLTKWRKVTENVLIKGWASNTLPGYVQEGDTICQNCYNRIVINNSLKFQ